LAKKSVENTALLTVYARGLSTDVPQTFDNFTVNAIVRDKMHLLNISDCAIYKSEGLKSVTYANADVILFTFNQYDITSYESLKTKWYYEVIKYCPRVPTLLIGVQSRIPKDKHNAIPLEKTADLARDLNVVNYYTTTTEDEENIKQIFSDATNAAVDPNIIISLEGKLEFTVLGGRGLGKSTLYCKFGFTDKKGHFVHDKFHKTKSKKSGDWRSTDKNSSEFLIQEPTEAKKFKVEVWDCEVLSSELLGSGFIFFKEFQDKNENSREIDLKPRLHIRSVSNSQPKLKVKWKFTPKIL